MKSIHHFREDWLLTLENIFDREMSKCIIISDKIDFLENIFDREMKSECIQSQRVFDREKKSECIHHFREDWLGYSGERFGSGNEE